MTYPLVKKNANGITGNNTVEESSTNTPLVGSVEPDSTVSELPANFGEVVKGIYRGSFPQPSNLPALKVLGLKTIITLVEEPYTPIHANFLKENGITHHRIAFLANKDPAVKTPETVVNHIMEVLLDKSNHPIYIHCNKGKHRTGCVTGCFRKLQGWDMQDILKEYVRYSFPKQRSLDEAFIEAFDTSKLFQLVHASGAKLWKPAVGSNSEPRHGFDQKSPKRLIPRCCNKIRVS